MLLPQILAGYEDITKRNVTWEQIAQTTDIVLAFGGMALKNSMVAGGSISKHVERGAMAAAQAAANSSSSARCVTICRWKPAPNGWLACPAPTPP